MERENGLNHTMQVAEKSTENPHLFDNEMINSNSNEVTMIWHVYVLYG